MAQWVNISQCARMYGRSRKWVDNRIKKHNISTEKSADSTEKRFQLVDFIAQCGEPENNGTTAPHNGSEQGSTPNGTPDLELLRQENQHLHRRIAELEAFLAQLQAQLAWMQGIIDKQMTALPKPNDRGVVQQVIRWMQVFKQA